eukprot:2649794-Alexandrium_andersonii.AAC.1
MVRAATSQPPPQACRLWMPCWGGPPPEHQQKMLRPSPDCPAGGGQGQLGVPQDCSEAHLLAG